MTGLQIGLQIGLYLATTTLRQDFFSSCQWWWRCHMRYRYPPRANSAPLIGHVHHADATSLFWLAFDSMLSACNMSLSRKGIHAVILVHRVMWYLKVRRRGLNGSPGINRWHLSSLSKLPCFLAQPTMYIFKPLVTLLAIFPGVLCAPVELTVLDKRADAQWLVFLVFEYYVLVRCKERLLIPD